MRREHRNKQVDYWPSFTDVITNLLLIFIFIFVILIIKNYFDNVEIQRLKYIVGTIENDLESLKQSFTGFKIEGPDDVGNLRIVIGEDLVKFPSDQFEIRTLSPQARNVLTNVGQQIKAAFESHPSLFTITIEGYTDTRGSTELNYDLSYRRAKSVMLYWAYKVGLDPDVYDITPSGFGEQRSKLKISTGDEVSSSKNRRIEIRITPKFKDLMKLLNEKSKQ